MNQVKIRILVEPSGNFIETDLDDGEHVFHMKVDGGSVIITSFYDGLPNMAHVPLYEYAERWVSPKYREATIRRMISVADDELGEAAGSSQGARNG